MWLMLTIAHAFTAVALAALLARFRLGEDSPFVQGFGKTIHPRMLAPANANPGFQAARLKTMTGVAHEHLAG